MGTGGVAKRLGALRVQYYCVMGAVAAAVVLATLRYMPGPAPVAAAPGEALGGRKRKEEAREKEDDGGVVLFNFGDSNSDTGGAAAVMGIRIAPPEGRAFFRRPTGRLSDGRVVLDFICELRRPLSALPCCCFLLARPTHIDLQIDAANWSRFRRPKRSRPPSVCCLQMLGTHLNTETPSFTTQPRQIVGA
jgi:hypothetical protein